MIGTIFVDSIDLCFPFWSQRLFFSFIELTFLASSFHYYSASSFGDLFRTYISHLSAEWKNSMLLRNTEAGLIINIQHKKKLWNVKMIAVWIGYCS